jgi:hypothetical protein
MWGRGRFFFDIGEPRIACCFVLPDDPLYHRDMPVSLSMTHPRPSSGPLPEENDTASTGDSAEQLSHKGIVPRGLFSSASDTASGWTVVEQIESNFSGAERDFAEHAGPGRGTRLPPNVTSNTQCRRFSINQCCRMAAICRSSSIGKLDRKNRRSAVTAPCGLTIRIDSTARMLRTPGHSASMFSSVGTGCTNTRRRVRRPWLSSKASSTGFKAVGTAKACSKKPGFLPPAVFVSGCLLT